MEAFTFSCPHCRQSLTAPEELMGQVVECPSCHGEVELPPGVGATDTASATQSPAEEVPPEELMAAKVRKRKANLWAGAILGLLFGPILMGVGLQNSNLRKTTEGEPKSMTLAELVEKGPGDNRYVELTNLIYGDKFWIEEKHGTWQGAWTFLFKKDDPRTPVAAAYLKDGGEKMITEAMAKDSLRGFVDKRKKFFDSYTGRQLYDMYPHVTSRDAEYFVRVVTWRPSQRGISITYGFGAGLIFIGLILAGFAILYGKGAPARRG